MPRFRDPAASPARVVSLNLGHLARWIFFHYAQKRHQSMSEVMRSLAGALVRVDSKRGLFDRGAFARFLAEQPDLSAAECDALLAELDECLRDAGTASSTAA